MENTESLLGRTVIIKSTQEYYIWSYYVTEIEGKKPLEVNKIGIVESITDAFFIKVRFEDNTQSNIYVRNVFYLKSVEQLWSKICESGSNIVLWYGEDVFLQIIEIYKLVVLQKQREALIKAIISEYQVKSFCISSVFGNLPFKTVRNNMI